MTQHSKSKATFTALLGASALAITLASASFAQSNNGQRKVVLPKPPKTGNSATNAPGAPATKPTAAPTNGPGSKKPVLPTRPAGVAGQTTQKPSSQPGLQDQKPQEFQRESVILFSSKAIDTVQMNGKDADGERISDTIVEVYIQGDANGISCTNIFDITFTAGPATKLTANHCHGTTEFPVLPGQILDEQEVHDASLDERASGIETASADFKWSYFANKKMTALQYSVPETDHVLLFAECDRGTRNASFYSLVSPGELQAEESVSLDLIIDGGTAQNYALEARHFPYLDKPLVPTLQMATGEGFFEKLASGQIADFYINAQISGSTSIRIPLKGSAKPVRSFAAACSK